MVERNEILSPDPLSRTIDIKPRKVINTPGMSTETNTIFPTILISTLKLYL